MQRCGLRAHPAGRIVSALQPASSLWHRAREGPARAVSACVASYPTAARARQTGAHAPQRAGSARTRDAGHRSTRRAAGARRAA